MRQGGRPVARNGLFLLQRHLAEGFGQDFPAGRSDRSRIRASRAAGKTSSPSTRPSKLCVSPSGKASVRTQMKCALNGGCCANRAQLRLDLRPRHGEITRRPGPARRINAGLAAERIDAEPRIIGERRRIRARARRRAPSAANWRGSVVPVSSGSGKPEFAGRDRRDAILIEQLAHFGELARIMRRDDELSVETLAFRRRALLQFDEL